MVIYSEPIFKKNFTSESIEKAKLNACKWINNNIACKDELHDVLCNIVKNQNSQLPSVTVTLFTFIDSDTVKERHCKICKEFHQSFFINDKYNCNECKSMAFQQRMEDCIRVKKQYYKEKLRKVLRESGE